VRRRQRKRRFREIDHLRCLSATIVSSLAEGILGYPEALGTLKEILAPYRHRAWLVERVLFGEKNQAMISLPVLQLLAVDLGLVEFWEQHLRGRSARGNLRQAFSRSESVLERIGPLGFLLRARSAARLGLIRHRPSWCVLVRALDDPHPDVRSAALRALAAIAEPQSFAALAERLQAEALAPSGNVSVPELKAALVCFPLRQAPELAPLLEHPHSRVRLLAAEVVREMVAPRSGVGDDLPLRPQDLAPELAELFLSRLALDENPDVRARAAAVIARLADSRAGLRLGMLLEDAQWFVRLHAVRAIAQRRFIKLAGNVTEHLTDANWRVREAAVRTLLSFGLAGAERLREHFLTTQDPYSLEQIVEELQRHGLLPLLLGDSGQDGDARKTRVIERLVRMGKNSSLLTVLESATDHRPYEPLLEGLAPKPNFG
jgi:HEAT repeat protein